MGPIILDTDIGTDIDDTWALAMLLRCPELDLRLVTTVSGDPVYRARIVARILETAGRDDIPIATGIAGGGNAGYPQARFAADVDLERYRAGVSDDAVAALIACVMSADELVVVLSIGPATNVARALDIEPAIAARARFVGMQGSVRVGYRGKAGPVPEYNVYVDVDAFRTVLAAPWDILLSPLDTCGSVVIDGPAYESLTISTDPLVRSVVSTSQEWAEHTGRDVFTHRSSTLYDCAAVYLVYDDALVHVERLPIEVDDDGTMRITEGAREVSVATSWRDRSAFTDQLVGRLLGDTPSLDRDLPPDRPGC